MASTSLSCSRRLQHGHHSEDTLELRPSPQLHRGQCQCCHMAPTQPLWRPLTGPSSHGSPFLLREISPLSLRIYSWAYLNVAVFRAFFLLICAGSRKKWLPYMSGLPPKTLDPDNNAHIILLQYFRCPLHPVFKFGFRVYSEDRQAQNTSYVWYCKINLFEDKLSYKRSEAI